MRKNVVWLRRETRETRETHDVRWGQISQVKHRARCRPGTYLARSLWQVDQPRSPEEVE